MKVKVLEISVAALLVWLKPGRHGGYEVVSEGIPPDAIVLNVQFAWPQRMLIYLQHDSFPDSPDNRPLPEIKPLLQLLPDSPGPDVVVGESP